MTDGFSFVSFSRISTAFWHPAGALGLLYWWALWPAHVFLFAGLTRSLARRAEASARAEPAAGHGTP